MAIYDREGLNRVSAYVGGEAVDISGGDHAFSRTCDALWVGSNGDVTVTLTDGTVLTFTNVPDGSLLPIRVVMVDDSSSAGDMVGLWQ